MNLVPNIDELGCQARRRIGYALLIAAVVTALAWPFRTGSVLGWIIAALFAAGGAFSIFEARNAWCAVRAAGFKTRI